jgi:hypothetical protein
MVLLDGERVLWKAILAPLKVLLKILRISSSDGTQMQSRISGSTSIVEASTEAAPF